MDVVSIGATVQIWWVDKKRNLSRWFTCTVTGTGEVDDLHSFKVLWSESLQMSEHQLYERNRLLQGDKAPDDADATNAMPYWCRLTV